jgi:hypothetical protein
VKSQNPSAKSQPKRRTFALDDDDFECLLFALGLAVGCSLKNGNKKLAYRFLRLTNRINEHNPNFIPYAIPGDAALESDAQVGGGAGDVTRH